MLERIEIYNQRIAPGEACKLSDREREQREYITLSESQARAYLGPWRPKAPGEVVDPIDIREINGERCVPQRLYGALIEGVPVNLRQLGNNNDVNGFDFTNKAQPDKTQNSPWRSRGNSLDRDTTKTGFRGPGRYSGH